MQPPPPKKKTSKTKRPTCTDMAQASLRFTEPAFLWKDPRDGKLVGLPEALSTFIYSPKSHAPMKSQGQVNYDPTNARQRQEKKQTTGRRGRQVGAELGEAGETKVPDLKHGTRHS